MRFSIYQIGPDIIRDRPRIIKGIIMRGHDWEMWEVIIRGTYIHTFYRAVRHGAPKALAVLKALFMRILFLRR